VTVIIAFSAFLIILEYFGIRSEHWRKVFARSFGFLGQSLPRIGRGYLLIHPYIGVILAVIVTIMAAIETYTMFSNSDFSLLSRVVIIWLAVILIMTTVPEQIRRIQGKNWPPRF